jgi:hypothetical protein
MSASELVIHSMAPGVVAGTDVAVDFYKKLDGRAAGYHIDPDPIWRSRNQIIIWDAIETLPATAELRRPE